LLTIPLISNFNKFLGGRDIFFDWNLYCSPLTCACKATTPTTTTTSTTTNKQQQHQQSFSPSEES